MAAEQQAVQQANDAHAEQIVRVGQSLSAGAGLCRPKEVCGGEPVYLQALKVYQTMHGEFHADVDATLNNLEFLHRMYGPMPRRSPY